MRRIGRPSKSLPRLVRDSGFRARRDAERLRHERPVPGRPDLIALQRRYRAAESEKERYAIALEFEHAVKRDNALMPLGDALYAQLGPCFDEAEKGTPPAVQSAFELWDSGVEARAWRVEQGLWDWQEALDWFELLTGERTEDTRRVEQELADWQWLALEQVDEWKREGKLPEPLSGPPDPREYVGLEV